MKIGAAMFITDETVQPVELGVMVEERGLDALYLTEHTHIPTRGGMRHPSGGAIPRAHTRTVDPFVALAAVAATTSRITLGTAICLLAQRDPIVTAKAAATLDLISGGRFIFGVGAGWNLEEAASHGLDPAKRFAVLRDKIEAVRALWTQDEVVYEGPYVSIPPMLSFPKPVTKPHPPIYLGAFGPKALDRVISHGDGWMPSTSMLGDDELLERIHELHRRSRDETGRAHLPIALMSPPRSMDVVQRYQDADVEQYAVWLPAGGRDVVEPALNELALIAGKLA